MALKYWWLLPLAVLAMGAVVSWVWRRRPSSQPTPVAHADRLTALPAYQAAVKRQRYWMLVAVAAIALLAMSLAVAAARPVSKTTTAAEQVNRDIMLCLDVSGSMVSTDEAIVSVFSQLVEGFRGERIGMVIFDSSAVTVFPLTDDYDFVATELTTAREALGGSSFDFFAGTYESPGSSLIGDGLASCTNGFPNTSDSKRSRSIIFATDNMLAGKPIFSLEEAAALATQAGIRIYTLNPNDFGESTFFGAAANGLKKASTGTGGAYYALESDTAVDSIVKKVQATEASRIKGAPQLTVVDHPGWPLGLALLALLMLGAAAWRLRR